LFLTFPFCPVSSGPWDRWDRSDFNILIRSTIDTYLLFVENRRMEEAMIKIPGTNREWMSCAAFGFTGLGFVYLANVVNSCEIAKR
jgi:hypothetical protein